MLNKFNTRTLVIALVVLAGGAAAMMMLDAGPPTSGLPQHLVEFDSTALTSIQIKPKEGSAYTLEKEGTEWKLVLSSGKKVPIDQSKLSSVLATLSQLDPQKLISRNAEKHGDFEVDETKGIAIKLMAGGTEIANLIVGKFSVSQMPRQGQQQMMQQGSQPKISTYVRLSGQDEVYQVEGGLSWDLNKKPADWRNSDIIKFSQYQLSKLEVRGELAFTLSKDTANQWIADGIDLDSAGRVNYVKNVMSLSTNDFNDEVEGSGRKSVLEIYLTSDEGESTRLSIQEGRLLQSSDVPNAYFNLTQEEYDKLLPATTSMEGMDEGGENL